MSKEKAIKRLQRDLIEWNELCYDIPNIRALPLDNNIFEWHCNIRPQLGPLKGIYIHMILLFPENYPTCGPKISVSHRLNHPNVIKNSLCLDMLNESDWCYGDEYQGWTPAYSVYSILSQIQFIILGGVSVQTKAFRLEWSEINRGFQRNRIKIKQVSEEFLCHKCGHSHQSPWPPVEFIPKSVRKRVERSAINASINTDDDIKEIRYFDMLYDDIEAIIYQYLSLRDMLMLSKINTRWGNIVKNSKALVLSKYKCWYQKLDIYHSDKDNLELILGYGIAAWTLFQKCDTQDWELLSPCNVSFDLLSHYAFYECDTTTTMWGAHSLSRWIPIYINKKHGDNIWECLSATVVEIWNNDDYIEQKIVYLIAFIMDSIITDVIKTRLHEFKRFSLKNTIDVVEALFHYHHLLLAVFDKYHDILKPYIEGICSDFINRKDKDRDGDVHFGLILIYFTLTEYNWNDIMRSYMAEMFISDVEDVLKLHPELLYLETDAINCYRLTKTFNATTESKKLLSFQAFVIKKCLEFGRVNWRQKLKEYNDNFGCPPANLYETFQKKCTNINNIKTWNDLFDSIQVTSISMQKLTQWLKHSIYKSKELGWTKKLYSKKMNKAIWDRFGATKDINERNKQRSKCICNKDRICIYSDINRNESENIEMKYDIKDNIFSWWHPNNNKIQCFDDKTCRWYNASIVQLLPGLTLKIKYKVWKYIKNCGYDIYGDNIVKPNTYEIKDETEGYFDKTRMNKTSTLKSIQNEYQKLKALNNMKKSKDLVRINDAKNKKFFISVQNNLLNGLQKILNLPCTAEEFVIIKDKMKTMKSNKYTGKYKIVNDWVPPFNVNMTDVKGRTPLFVSVYYGHGIMTKLLVYIGVDVNVVDKYGETVFDVAKQAKSEVTPENKQIYNSILKFMKPFKVHKRNRYNNSVNDDVKSRDVLYKNRYVYFGNINGSEKGLINGLMKSHGLRYTSGDFNENNIVLMFKMDYKALKAKIDVIDGSFYGGQTISATILNSNDKRLLTTNKKTRDVVVRPNTCVVVKNFDIHRDTKSKLEKLFKKFGNIDRLIVKTNKFGEPFCFVRFKNIKDAIKLCEYNCTTAKGLNIGDDNVLDIQYYSKEKSKKPTQHKQNTNKSRKGKRKHVY